MKFLGGLYTFLIQIICSMIFGNVEKDPYGLKKRFCNFMDNMMMGPYLSTGRILRKYDEVLDE